MVKKRQTSGEFTASLEKDPAYVRLLEDTERQAQKYRAEREKYEAPVVRDLRAAGFGIETVWDLVNTNARYPEALPILFEHLQGDYPDSVKIPIARALAVPESKRWWTTVLALFRSSRDEKVNGVKTVLAAVLSAAADDDVVPDVIRLIDEPSHGEHRIMLLDVLARSARPEAGEALERAAQDPQLRKEARRQLRLRAKRRRTGILN